MLNNPIVRAELAHQRQPTERWHGLRWLIRSTYRAMAGISLLLFLTYLVHALVGWDTRAFAPISRMIRTVAYNILFGISLIAHFSAILRTLLLASNAISREKRGRTWDTLLLTRVDARQLVVGKWWATVRHMWPSFLAAGALRLGLVVWLAIGMKQTFPLSPNPIYLNPYEILLAGSTVLLLSLVNTGVTAAFGVLASLLTHRSGRALVSAIFLRTFVLLFLAGELWIGADAFRHALSGNASRWVMSASATSLLESASRTMLDNGSLLATGLAGGTLPRPMGESQYLIYILIPLVLYLLLTWMLLWIAQKIAVQQGAFQPTRFEYFKPKKKKKIAALPLPE